MAEDIEAEFFFRLTTLSKKAVRCGVVYWNHETHSKVLEQSKETLGSKEDTEYLEQQSNCDTLCKDKAVSTTSKNKISGMTQIFYGVDCEYYDENSCNLCGK